MSYDCYFVLFWSTNYLLIQNWQSKLFSKRVNMIVPRQICNPISCGVLILSMWMPIISTLRPSRDPGRPNGCFPGFSSQTDAHRWTTARRGRGHDDDRARGVPRQGPTRMDTRWRAEARRGSRPGLRGGPRWEPTRWSFCGGGPGGADASLSDRPVERVVPDASGMTRVRESWRVPWGDKRHAFLIFYSAQQTERLRAKNDSAAWGASGNKPAIGLHEEGFRAYAPTAKGHI